jgi:DNA-binding transcriptional ArsR family regulator
VTTLEALQVIAAPRRLRILELVWDRELSAGDIAAQFEVSWSAVSQHIRVLKDAGFLSERREGNSRLYRTDKAALGPLRAVVEDHWRTSLDRVKDLAEREQRDKDER